MSASGWKKWAVIGLFGLSSSFSQAATTTDNFWDRSESTVNASAGLGLAILSGSTGWAINFGALTRATESAPVYWGADVAFNFWGTSPSLVTPSTGATAIQLLPTVVYGFSLETWPNVYPYVGLSVGPNVYVEKLTVGSSTTTSTSVFFELLFRVGANVAVTDSLALNIEPKLGILRSDFIFLPQVNLVLSI
jgi:hypothetical protein